MKAFADDLAVADDNAAHGRIGAGQANAFAREGQRVLHEANVVFVHGLIEKGIRVRLGVKGNQIVDLFAGADKANRQAQLARNGDDDAAFRGAIELGENNPRNAHGRGEFAGLRQAVLSRGRVENEENIVWRAGDHFGRSALHFFEFGHQIGFRVQATSGVHDDDIGRARLGGGHGIVNHGSGVGAGLLLDDFHAIALGPDFELLDGRGAESVCGTKDYAAMLLPQPVCQFADAGRFAGAIDPHDEDYARARAVWRRGDTASAGNVRSSRSVQDAQDVRFDFALELRGVGESVAIQFFADGVEDFARGVDAEVGGEQRRLEVLEERRVDLALAEKNRINGFGKRRLGLADGLLQLLKERRFRLVFAKKGDHTVGAVFVHATSNC